VAVDGIEPATKGFMSVLISQHYNRWNKPVFVPADEKYFGTMEFDPASTPRQNHEFSPN
jgi:hypothetical protein